MNKIYLSIALFFLSSFIYGINDSIPGSEILSDQKVKIIAKHREDSIVLRWAPADAGWWFYGINEGYRISRRDINAPERAGYDIIAELILPWSEEKMENHFLEDQTREEIIVPLQTIHRDWENTHFDGNLLEAEEKRSYFEQRYQMDLLASDLHSFVADASGLRYVDKNIDPQKQYAYRVEFVRDTTQFDHVIAFKDFYQDHPIIFEAEEMEEVIKIRWEKKGNNKKYTSYFVERSADGENFTRLNDLPYTHGLSDHFAERKFNVFADSVENYKPFYYRIVGIDAFGDESTPSNIVLAKGRDRTPPAVEKITTSLDEQSGTVMINWDHPDMREIMHALIYKSDVVDRTKVVYKSENNFEKTIVDSEVKEGVSDYYLVLVDTAGNVAQSVKSTVYVKDITPPVAPEGLKSEVDTTGLITLSWDQGPDQDIIGYFVYSADHKGKNFIKLNQEKHPMRVYVDSVNAHQLTQFRYYKVAAVDKGGNIGPYSDVLEVRRPDKVPPAPALFYNYKVDTAGIFLGITPSSSRDVVRHVLYRTEEHGQQQEIKVFTDDMQPIYWDKNLKSNTKYTYQLVAVDHGGLMSSTEHSTMMLTSYDMRVSYRPEISLSTMENGISVTVINTIPGDDYRIEIFRAIDGSKYKPIKYLDGTLSFEDVLQNKDNEQTVKYRGRILYRDGKRSKIGDEQSILF